MFSGWFSKNRSLGLLATGTPSGQRGRCRELLAMTCQSTTANGSLREKWFGHNHRHDPCDAKLHPRPDGANREHPIRGSFRPTCNTQWCDRKLTRSGSQNSWARLSRGLCFSCRASQTPRDVSTRRRWARCFQVSKIQEMASCPRLSTFGLLIPPPPQPPT